MARGCSHGNPECITLRGRIGQHPAPTGRNRRPACWQPAPPGRMAGSSSAKIGSRQLLIGGELGGGALLHHPAPAHDVTVVSHSQGERGDLFA